MKKCIKCKVTKDESEFYNSRTNKDGLNHSCKSCIRKYSRKQMKTPENTLKRKLRSREAYKFPEYRAQCVARVVVSRALAKGIITKTVCEAKGCHSTEGLQAHHYNGYEPENRLMVAFLCPICHRALHLGNLKLEDIVITETNRQLKND